MDVCSEEGAEMSEKNFTNGQVWIVHIQKTCIGTNVQKNPFCSPVFAPAWAEDNMNYLEVLEASLSLEQITVLSVFCGGVHPEVGINAEDWKLPTKYLSSTFLYLF